MQFNYYIQPNYILWVFMDFWMVVLQGL